jgi:Peptidase family M23
MFALRKGTLVWFLVLIAGIKTGGMAADVYTPVVVAALQPSAQPVVGTDGKQHLVYELVMTNASRAVATLQKIEVVDGRNPAKLLASFEGAALIAHIHNTGNMPVETAQIPFNETRVALVNFSMAAELAPHHPGTTAPLRLLHRITLMGTAPGHRPDETVEQHYLVAPIEVRAGVPTIGPPLAGTGWVAVNGCCEPMGVHRGTGLPVNGEIYFSQRFAIDWMKLDDAGRMVKGDASKVENYVDYGAEVLAVAEGTVVETLNTLDEQVPGKLPDPATITLENIDGNHVVIELGKGVYAFYAHLQKESVLVKKGQRVKRGQVLGKLGNTGNTSAPHLHFHLMDGPSVLGSNGLPYVIDGFALEGEVSAEKFAAAPTLDGDWGEGRTKAVSERKGQFPLDLNIVNFLKQKPAGSSAKQD